MTLNEYDRRYLLGVRATVIVPARNNTPIDEVLSSEAEVEQRSTLFFDESLKLLVCLEFPACPEDILQSYLKRLELRVDAWAVAASNSRDNSPIDDTPTKDLIVSQHVNTTDDPVTLVKQGDNDDEVRLQLIWEAQLTLGRPRIRSPDLSVIFLPIAHIVDAEDVVGQTDYLEPFMALEPNVLGALHSLPGLDDPYLPISRLEKVLPAPARKNDRIRLEHQTSDPIRAFAAVMPRLRYTKINTALPDPTTIASLDIEFIPSVDIKATIETIDVSMASGRVLPLMPDFLPISCKSRDCITFLYDLQSAHQSGTSTPTDSRNISSSTYDSSPKVNFNVDILSISLRIVLQLPGVTTATISMYWTTNVDFSLALNPAFGAPAQNLQRTNKPTSLNFAPYPEPNKGRNGANSARTASTSLQHQVIPQTAARQPLSSILSISFLAPFESIRVGIPFSWRVLVVNNSPQPVKLAIVPLVRIQRPTNATQHFQKRHAPKASNASLPPASTLSTQPTDAYKKHTRDSISAAKAVVEEHVLYALHHQTGVSAVPPEADLVSLTAELRIGPLGTGQCHETEVEFIAYKTGVFTVDAIRVVDLTKEAEGGVGTINDIRELPEVVVVDV